MVRKFNFWIPVFALIFLAVAVLAGRFAAAAFADYTRRFPVRALAQFQTSSPLPVKISYAGASFHPLREGLVLHFREPEVLNLHGETLMTAERLDAYLDPAAFFKGKIVMVSMTWIKSRVAVIRRPDGSWNLRPFPEHEDGDEVLTFYPGQVRELSMNFPDPEISYADLSSKDSGPFKFTAQPKFFTVTWPSAGSPVRFNSEGLRGGAPWKLSFSCDAQSDACDFQFLVDGGRFMASGTVEQLESDPIIQGAFEAHQLDTGILTQESSSGLAGSLTLKMDAVTRGSHPKIMLKNLKSKGAMDIRRGRFKNHNILRELFVNMAPLPDLKEMASKPLTPSLQGTDLAAAETSFDILQASTEILQERVFLEDLRIQGSGFLMRGEGSWGFFSRDADFRAECAILEAQSAKILDAYPVFEALKNENQRLMIPFIYKGLWPGVRVEPDLNYIQTQIEKRGQTAQTGGNS